MINQFFHCFFCCSQTCWGCHSAVFVIQGYAELEAHFWWPRYLKILKKDLQHRILIAKEWNCWILQFNYMHSYANLKVISIRKLYKNINWQKFYSKSKDDSVFKLQTVLFLNILHIDIGETYFNHYFWISHILQILIYKCSWIISTCVLFIHIESIWNSLEISLKFTCRYDL